MKIFNKILIAGVWLWGLSPLQSIHAQQFEGSITYELEADGAIQNFTYLMKEDQARVEIASDDFGGKVVILLSTVNENMIMLMEQLGIYMEVPMPQGDHAEEQEQAEGFHLTGEKKTIANHECQQYIYKDENGHETEVWTPVEADFGSFLFPGMGDDKMGSLKQPEMPAFSFFPFLLVSHADGEQVRMEVVSVDEESLDEVIFTIPEGFRKMNMPMFGN